MKMFMEFLMRLFSNYSKKAVIPQLPLPGDETTNSYRLSKHFHSLVKYTQIENIVAFAFSFQCYCIFRTRYHETARVLSLSCNWYLYVFVF